MICDHMSCRSPESMFPADGEISAVWFFLPTIKHVVGRLAPVMVDRGRFTKTPAHMKGT